MSLVAPQSPSSVPPGERSSGRLKPDAAQQVEPAKQWWRSRHLQLALLGGLLMYVIQPPLNLWPLAWIAPAPWLLLIRRPELESSRPYLKLWIAGFVYLLASLQWLRLPHWATHFGWLALCFYLALYVPAFVAICRVAVHRFRWSIILAAPVVWTGLAWARGHLLTGFLMGELGHTQHRWVQLIQLSDIAGAYGVEFLVMFVAACIARMWPMWNSDGPGARSASRQAPSRVRVALWPLAPMTAAFAVALGYGSFRMSGNYTAPGPTVALIQGSIPSSLKADRRHAQTVFQQYYDLSKQAVSGPKKPTLVVWPETMFRSPLISASDDLAVPADIAAEEPSLTPEGWKRRLEDYDAVTRENIQGLAELLGTSLLLGIDIHHYTGDQLERYNSAVFTDPQGKLLGRYDKMHRVMFGEYIPLAYYFPVLYRLTPLPSGINAGTGPECVEVAGAKFSPNICYETVIPHCIRGHVAVLRERAVEPEVLVNLTNDGWFRNSSELDMHLACGVFRAIECRKPLLIAANTGFSGWIDGDGRILKQSRRGENDVIVADVQLDNRNSIYLQYGAWFSGVCLTISLGLAGLAWLGFGQAAGDDPAGSAAA